jgi:formylglycine-generating enzyme required for sulfatase activity
MKVAECYTLMPFWPFQKAKVYGQGMRLAKNYLQRKGYRLPTEAEWEYACRAGANTIYSFGNPESFLKFYAWFYGSFEREPHRVGLLKPNDFGLFDMHGNALEWTLNRRRNRGLIMGGVVVDVENGADMRWITDKDHRVLRGGSYMNHAAFSIPCGHDMAGADPSNDVVDFGFRVARTIEQ